MEARYTNIFSKEYKKLPRNMQKRAQRTIILLINNFCHPSLRVHKIKGTQNIWEARITKGYRITFRIEAEFYILRHIGTHSIIEHP